MNWTLTDEKDVKWMEAGQRPVLRDAMEDVAKTVEYMLQYEEKQDWLRGRASRLHRKAVGWFDPVILHIKGKENAKSS